jgi:hypothetical protein
MPSGVNLTGDLNSKSRLEMTFLPILRYEVAIKMVIQLELAVMFHRTLKLSILLGKRYSINCIFHFYLYRNMLRYGDMTILEIVS